jgi:serine/threonine protein kinase
VQQRRDVGNELVVVIIIRSTFECSRGLLLIDLTALCAVFRKSIRMPSGQQVTLKEELAEGGFAVVMRASNGHTTFALKRMVVGPGRGVVVPDKLQRAQTEVELLKRAHAASPELVVRLVEHLLDADAGLAWLLMEFAPLGSLKERLDALPLQRMHFAALVPLLVQVATALADLHALEPCIVHRDVKCENVLFFAHDRVKLCDFGSAKAGRSVPRTSRDIADAESDIEANTTPAYRAPEQVDLFSKLEQGPAVDAWAFGVLMFLALHGRHAFGGGEGGLSSLATFEWPDDTPGVPPTAERVCRMLLDKDPASRSSMRRLLATLAPMAKLQVPARHRHERTPKEDEGDASASAPKPRRLVSPRPVEPAPQAPTAPAPAPAPPTASLFASIDLVALGTVQAATQFLAQLHAALFADRDRRVVCECLAPAGVAFFSTFRAGWLRFTTVDAISGTFLAQYCELLAQKAALLGRYRVLDGSYALLCSAQEAPLFDAACAQVALQLCQGVVVLLGPLVAAAEQLNEEQRACAASAVGLVTEASRALLLASHVLSRNRSPECVALQDEFALGWRRCSRLFQWAAERRLPVQLFALPADVPTFDGAFVIPLATR